MKLQPLWILGTAAALSLAACGTKAAEGSNDAAAAPAADALVEAAEQVESTVATATTQLESRSGTEVTGTVTFAEIEITAGDEVIEHRVEATYALQGLPEGAVRGFHIHEVGDCSAPDATSAGGHFNPGGHQHGAPGHDDSHAGDLGNITADADGNAAGTVVIPGYQLTIAGDADTNIVGRAVIVHVGTDDLVSQPTGDAGARAACGVISAE